MDGTNPQKARSRAKTAGEKPGRKRPHDFPRRSPAEYTDGTDANVLLTPALRSDNDSSVADGERKTNLALTAKNKRTEDFLLFHSYFIHIL